MVRLPSASRAFLLLATWATACKDCCSAFNIQAARSVRNTCLFSAREDWRQLAPESFQSVLDTAKEAAYAAGAIILDNVGAPMADFHEKTSIKDIVTEFDGKAQEVVEEAVRARHPQHSFLGEENVAPGSEASAAALKHILEENDWVWIVDPIDGTANFASGLALCAVAIGVAYKGTTVVGVIYDPHRDELFSAIKGQGSFLNGLPIKTGVVNDMKDAIINAGYPADPMALDASMRGMRALSSRSRGIRVIACSALTTAWIACGRLTAHFGYDLSSWDLAAGALLIQEAGGKVTDLDGSEYKIETRSMLCSNGKVHDEILDALRKADAVSFQKSQPSTSIPQ